MPSWPACLDRLRPSPPTPRARALALLKLLQPYDAVGLTKVRLGNPGQNGTRGDGGYVMIDRLDGISAALSLGIGDDVSWDMDLARRGIPVHQFDHSVDAPPQDHPLFRFRRMGVRARDGADPNMLSLDAIVRDEVRVRGDLLLKIDVEGAEWQVFAAASAATLRRFAQIVVEIHDPLDRADIFPAADDNLAVLRKLARTHAVVHVHANNYGSVDDIDGIGIPVAIEITWLRRDSHRFVPAAGPFPGPCDAPNRDGVADIAIGGLLRQRR